MMNNAEGVLMVIGELRVMADENDKLVKELDKRVKELEKENSHLRDILTNLDGKIVQQHE